MSFYSPEFKRCLVERIIKTPGLSVDDLAVETGVAPASLFSWIKIYGPCDAGLIKRRIKPSSWSTAQKLRALLETQQLGDDALGEYLRRIGLYYANLVEWKAEILDEVKKNKDADTIPASEATALLDLKKKAESIWPVVEEEKPQENTEKRPLGSSKKLAKKGPG